MIGQDGGSAICLPLSGPIPKIKLRQMQHLSFLKTAFLLLFLSFGGLALAQQPVAIEIIAPDSVNAGETFIIKVNFSTISDWYIYAPTGRNEIHGMIETRVKYALKEGVALAGTQSIPVPKPKGMYEIYEGAEIPYVQKFQVSENITPGELEIPVEITFQTCNKQMCLPPVTEIVKAKVIVE